jgi:succinyl-diaminopimelate desuccinylase
LPDTKDALLAGIERDRDRLVEFLSGFVRARSPNPPGDTLAAAAHVRKLLDAEGIDYKIVDPQPTMPNIVATFDGAKPGPHLVLNGHIDVFPVGQEKWQHDPWGGIVADGKIWGRGASDMKCGTSCSIWTFIYLHRIRDRLKGRLTLTAVSDEETFGPWGARYLIEHHPDEVLGDCCLNGEPSGSETIRFGERGLLWLAVTVKTRGAHGAYVHLSKSASRIAAEIVGELAAIEKIRAPVSHNFAPLMEAARVEMDRALGAGATDIVNRVTLNVGKMDAGLKVNMIPAECRLELDIRLPLGVERETVMREVNAIVARHPEASVEEINHTAGYWCDPHGTMIGFMQNNVQKMTGQRPKPIVSLGGTDARLWRKAGVPAYVYGPVPSGMGGADEHVEIEEFLHVMRTHVLSAYDYLTQ